MQRSMQLLRPRCLQPPRKTTTTKKTAVHGVASLRRRSGVAPRRGVAELSQTLSAPPTAVGGRARLVASRPQTSVPYSIVVRACRTHPAVRSPQLRPPPRHNRLSSAKTVSIAGQDRSKAASSPSVCTTHSCASSPIIAQHGAVFDVCRSFHTPDVTPVVLRSCASTAVSL
jgi:hypothetical protein